MDFNDACFAKVVILGFKGLLTDKVINKKSIPSEYYRYVLSKCEGPEKHRYDLRIHPIKGRPYSTFITRKIIKIDETENVIFDLDLSNHFAYYLDHSVVFGRDAKEYFNDGVCYQW